jgi:outer membrane protein
VFAVELDNLPEQAADLAAPEDPKAPKFFFGSLGAAAVNTARYVGSDVRQTFPLPLVYFNYNDRVFWSISSAGAWLVRSDDHAFKLGLLAKARGRIDGEDTPYGGINDREASIDAGLNATWRTRAVTLGASWTADALGRYHGQTANLRLLFPIQVNDRWTTTPSFTAEWLDRDTVDYYYGVSANETGGGAPAYEGTATTNLRAGWSLNYRASRQWRVLGGLSYTRLGSGIADSPLVSNSHNLLAYAGFTWTFSQRH